MDINDFLCWFLVREKEVVYRMFQIFKVHLIFHWNLFKLRLKLYPRLVGLSFNILYCDISIYFLTCYAGFLTLFDGDDDEF